MHYTAKVTPTILKKHNISYDYFRERNTFMNTFMRSEPQVGYAYVLPQQLGKVYPPKRALAEGTIFPELAISMHDYTRGIRHGTQK
jgi:hypothetical protein